VRIPVPKLDIIQTSEAQSIGVENNAYYRLQYVIRQEADGLAIAAQKSHEAG